ncbi:hypothetical protein Cri9333_4907 (plasmid) [Crinalium epipsammum PCC 9333]|uniref:Uncharacterized protein n=1 Tax=Crinalium epipsammum PCC 9333 TaxID=1173022 RepID=K9W5P7_9CYAN|nr:hypothetical protein [Crinalium epipsammum]AFZ15668.1 hypothetical protein Cri9333_4907 [Crinalium epipsammum PCC 9333]
MNNEVLSTAQAAELLGVSAGTLRTWKSRKADLLVEGTHWINQDGSTFWTQAGLDVLQGVSSVSDGETVSVASSETISVASSETISVASSETESATPQPSPAAHDPLQRYIPLVESVSNAITQGLIGRIDKAVTRNIGIAIAKPMTATECVTLLSELGLKPCNPELLLTGNQTNLLTESKE